MDRTKDFYDGVNDPIPDASKQTENGDVTKTGQSKPWEKFIPEESEKQEDHSPEDAGQTTEDEGQTNHYSSRYDAYRFQTPEPDGGGGDGGNGHGPSNGDSPRDPRKHSHLRTLLMAVGLFAALVLVVAAVAFGVSRVRNSGRNSGNDDGSSSGIVIGQSPSSGTSDASSSSSESVSQSSSVSEPEETESVGTESASSETESVESGAESVESAAESSESSAEGTQIGSGDASDTDLTIPEVVSKAMPSMVSITNVSEQEYEDIFGQTEKYQDVSAGSGIIVGKTEDEILIATNNHVISDSDKITVTFSDDQAVEGTLKGADADNDLAIVSVPFSDIPEKTQKVISVIAIGDSDSAQVGESVVAIGNALGYGQSVSSGIISALNRQVTDTDGTVRTMIQTDASINPGNSGGALLNMKGELIGINEAKLVDTSIEGVGYAIPMSTAEPILEKLGSKETRTAVSADKAGYLGVTVMTVPSAATSNGYPSGVYVSGVTSGGPADEAGLKKGDVITAVDGNSVTGNEDFLKELKYYAEGETVSLSVSRLNDDRSGFSKISVDVKLGSREKALGSDGTDSSESSDESASSSGESGQIEGNYGSLFGDDGGFGRFGN